MAVFTIPYPATGLTMYAGIYDSSGSIWDGAAYVTLASLTSLSAWQTIIIANQASEIIITGGTGSSIYQTADISATGYDQVIFYVGNPPNTYNAVASVSAMSTSDTMTKLGKRFCGEGGKVVMDYSTNIMTVYEVDDATPAFAMPFAQTMTTETFSKAT